MRFDFSQVQDIESFISIPEGIYACRIAEVREGIARDGSVRWSLRLEVAEGEYAGRTAGWDNLTWSDRGIIRVKRVLEILGFDVRGELDVDPQDLAGRRVRAEFHAEEREDALTGRRTLSLRVPYAGYAPDEAADLAGEEVVRDPSSAG
jgi:hypothetical protein